ncbi:MAG: phosphoribosylanthranilate isomerase [Roseburia sp.]|nr:phosphoribosylanthranilate isomerase [Roseburia sp.]
MGKIKICGLRRREDIAFANELKPDYIGFVFAESKRKVTEEEAVTLRELLHPFIPAAGVFVDQSTDFIVRLVKRGIIQMVQLHGRESKQEIMELRSQVQCPVIKAVRIPQSAEAKEAVLLAAELPVDYLLLDGGAGDGRTFAWEQIPAHVPKPYFLAGGISAENAKEALLRTDAFALDASSSVETDGKKDYDKMRELIRRVHNL